MAVLQEGKEPIDYCDMCRINMPAGQLKKNQQKACCFKNIYIYI